MLPKDPFLLLSIINTRLRDEHENLSDLCKAMDVKEKDLIEILASIDYHYDELTHQFH